MFGAGSGSQRFSSRIHPIWISALLLIAAAVPWTSLAPTSAEAKVGSASFSANPPLWRVLNYKASKLFITASTTVTLEVDAEAPAELYTPSPEVSKDHAPIPAVRINHGLILESDTLGRRSKEHVLFDAADGTAVQRHKRRLGSKGYSKKHRFSKGGVAVQRSSPGEAPSNADEREWTHHQETFFPLADESCKAVVDPAQIFYLLSASGLEKPGDSFEVCVFSKKVFGLMRAEVTAVTERKTDYQLDGRGISGQSPVIAIALTSSPLKGQPEDKKIELIGLEGDLEVFLDAESRVPVEICGDHSKLGSVSVRLVDAKTSKTQR